ncbi:1-aminocyclopropane-1-carboxylate deaminase/D-cysteine desulfhydrase [Sediminibacterium sp.]|uniref:1-aminocyclopropane-1-carboxylate deaminase/D-cysteine desulfhydrase n=1 Tax=Sediminibacterium sp. TaxID=1917865 RepID=UPI003F70F74B
MDFDINKIILQPLKTLSNSTVEVSTLRTDLIHPIVSGNKWFKLKYYLAEAKQLKYNTVASFGGAYSNHIVALAAACKLNGLNAIGFIRGEPADSPTLKEAVSRGMKLYYLSRETYKNKLAIMNQYANENWYWIQEGGYGVPGTFGAASILSTKDCAAFTHILCACGTGTMMAGLVAGSTAIQQVIGISVLKNNYGLEESIKNILPLELTKDFTTFHHYHFGGYAKHPPALIDYMNNLFEREAVPTDLVYTAKLFYAVEDLLEQQYFGHQASVLIIHSGGLQGNRSLTNNRLIF